MRRQNMKTNFIVLLFLNSCHLTFFGILVNAFTAVNKNQFPIEKVRHAMKLTTNGQSNITAAYLATGMWEEVTKLPDFSVQTPNIRILCNTLYASALIRIGRDKDAVSLYDRTFELMGDSGDETAMIDAKIGRGKALQRLMRYQDAQSDFFEVCQKLGNDNGQCSQLMQDKIASCAHSAAICALRLGDKKGAASMLSTLFNDLKDLGTIDSNLVGLYGSIVWEIESEDGKKAGLERATSKFSALQLLEHAASSGNASPVYQWFYAYISKSSCNMFCDNFSAIENDSILQIASINQSPFDDPSLINLDDKVLLHDLLHNSIGMAESWPNGFVLPRDSDQFRAFCATNTQGHWILKERAAYGSHGNQIFKNQGAANILKVCKCPTDLTLCQQLIEPSLLFRGRKFSIRVYVVYFNRVDKNNEKSAYLLDIGLAKLADAVYESSTSASDDIFMTNSGRIEGDGMTQYDLQSLRTFMEGESGEGSYGKTWNSIVKSISNVMNTFVRSHETNAIHSSLFSTVPKIMGFDYIIDTDLQPWLMEVNRFPGLEARGALDKKVKNQVIKIAWQLAALRANTDCGASSEKNSFSINTIEKLKIKIK